MRKQSKGTAPGERQERPRSNCKGPLQAYIELTPAERRFIANTLTSAADLPGIVPADRKEARRLARKIDPGKFSEEVICFTGPWFELNGRRYEDVTISRRARRPKK